MPVANDNKRRGRKRATVPNVSQRPRGGKPISAAKRKSPLPPQYNFTPAPEVQNSQCVLPRERVKQVRVSPELSTSRGQSVRDYPPPQRLFQSSMNQQFDVHALSEPEVQTTPGNQPPQQQVSRQQEPRQEDPRQHDPRQQILREQEIRQ